MPHYVENVPQILDIMRQNLIMGQKLYNGAKRGERRDNGAKRGEFRDPHKEQISNTQYNSSHNGAK